MTRIILGTLLESPYTILILCHSVPPRMRNISGSSCTENLNTLFIFSNFIFKNRAIYDMMWKNIVDLGMSQMRIWCMNIACWLHKIPTQKSEDLICTVAEAWNHSYQNIKGHFINCPWFIRYLYKDIALILFHDEFYPIFCNYNIYMLWTCMSLHVINLVLCS